MTKTIQKLVPEERAGSTFPQKLAEEIDSLIIRARLHGVRKYKSRNDFVEMACIKLLEEEERLEEQSAKNAEAILMRLEEKKQKEAERKK